jgi:WD40 repeat protein
MSAPQAVSWSPSGERLVAAEGSFAIRIWDVPQEVIRLGQPGYTTDAQWSPDMSMIASAGVGSLVRVWDSTVGDLKTTFTGHVLDVSGMQIAWFFSWSPSGELIVTSGEDHAARVWDPFTGVEHHAFLHDDEFIIESSDWSPDGTRIATGTLRSTGSPIFVWNVETGDLLNTFGGECFITEPSWSPDGTRVVSECTVGESYDAVVWDVVTGDQIIRFTEHTLPVSRPDWSPDGARIVSGSFDTTVRIWDAETGKEYLVYPGHNETVWDAEWSPDGTRIASGDEDGFLHIWNAETGEEVYRFEITGGIIHVEWSPDGKYVIVGGTTKVPEIRRVWQSTEELITYAKECCIFRELTLEEREQFGLSPADPFDN